jgi:hypothetical protein
MERRAGLIVVAPVAVVLSGPALQTARDAALIAAREVRLKRGFPEPYERLARALNDAMSANGGRTDVRETAAAEHCSQGQQTVTVDDAATLLGLTTRQTRRLAPRLGGRKSRGRWWLDEHAITEHVRGRASL